MRIMKDLVKEGLAIISGGGDLIPFGELMHEAWLVKRSLSATVSNSEVDDIYRRAMDAGALGGKLTGAGGGGFMVLFVPPERQAALREALRHLIYVPFKFEFSGSQIIFFGAEQDYPRSESDPLPAPFHAFPELAD